MLSPSISSKWLISRVGFAVVPIPINDYSNFTIKDFNVFLNQKMTQEEEKALKNVGRWICNKLLWILIIE